jgi:type II secretory pathway predicted ATPase ExeA
MYLNRFHLTRMPFEVSPDPGFFYASTMHRLALSMLEYAIVAGSELCLVTGEVGSGKTTLVQCLLARTPGARTTIGVVSNTHRVFGDLLDLILGAFQIVEDGGSAAKYRRLLAFVEDERRAGRRAALVVDEAQNLSVDDLEAIRILTNVNVGGRKALQIMLVGQPELRAKLKEPSLRQLVQRIPVDVDLKSLTRKDVGCYVVHRLRVCGGDSGLFSPAAIDAIARYSRGVPRVINLLCDLALVFAYAEHAPAVTDSIVADVVREKGAEGLFWHRDETAPVREPS